jgi:acyl-CoA thioesterase-1
MLFENDARIVFQGDSITDTGRDREDPESLGTGYAMMAAAWFAADHPGKTPRFFNRGIGGDRVKDLRARWERDCIRLEPTVVSILIGINDCWRRYDQNDPTPVMEFEGHYRFLLDRLKESGVGKIILCEPFVLPVPDDRRQWREDLDPKIAVVRELAREYQTLLLPLDGIFNSVSAYRPPRFWTPDGVHPSPAGHALIAKEWLKMMNCLC